ncbi:hypothetical protein ACJX0J_006708, partial [Zea mays]
WNILATSSSAVMDMSHEILHNNQETIRLEPEIGMEGSAGLGQDNVFQIKSLPLFNRDAVLQYHSEASFIQLSLYDHEQLDRLGVGLTLMPCFITDPSKNIIQYSCFISSCFKIIDTVTILSLMATFSMKHESFDMLEMIAF